MVPELEDESPDPEDAGHEGSDLELIEIHEALEYQRAVDAEQAAP